MPSVVHTQPTTTHDTPDTFTLEWLGFCRRRAAASCLAARGCQAREKAPPQATWQRRAELSPTKGRSASVEPRLGAPWWASYVSPPFGS